MTLTLSAQADAAHVKPWSDIIWLLELTLWRDKYGASPTSLVLRLSDADRYEVGQEWVGLIRSWGTLEDALNTQDTGGSIGTMDVELDDTRPVGGAATFSRLLRHGANSGAGTYDLDFADATLSALFRGGGAGDTVQLFRLVGEEIRGLSATSCTLRLSGVELALENRDDPYYISTLDFPLADPDAVNEPIPRLIGACRGERVYMVVAGIVHVLKTDMTPTSPASGGAIELSDGALLARMPTSGTVQIDDEKFDYQGRNLSTITLSGITRGASGTPIQAHDRGSVVFQVLSEYIGIVSENLGAHVLSGVPAIRADGAQVLPSSYTVELANTTIKPGRSFCLVRFPVLPIIKRQIQLTVTDTISVVDTIGVNDALGVGDNIGIGTTAQEVIVLNTSESLPILCSSSPGGSYYDFVFPARPAGGAILDEFWELGFTLVDALNRPVSSPAGEVLFMTPDLGNLVNLYHGGPAQINADARPVMHYSLAAWALTTLVKIFVHDWDTQRFQVRVTSFQHVTRRAVIMTKSGSAYRSGGVGKVGAAVKTGTVIIGGNSSADTVLGHLVADVTGLKDDGVGTISGTPNLLLENPTDCVKLALREVYGEKTAGLYDAAAWSSTRATHAALSWKWAGRLPGGGFQEARERMGRQAWADLFQDGGRWIWRYKQISEPVMTFDDTNTPDAETVIDWTARTDLVTALNGQYDWDADTQQWRGSIEKRSTTFLARWGARRRRAVGEPQERSLDLPQVRDATTATTLTGFWLEEWERKRQILQVTGSWQALHVSKGDTIASGVPKALQYGALGYGVRRKAYRIADRLIELQAVEIDTLPSAVILSGGVYLKAIMDRIFSGGYRVGRELSRTVAGGVRLRLIRELDVAGGVYVIPITAALLTGGCRLIVPVTTVLSGGFIMGVAWDAAGIYWDVTPIQWDGAISSELTPIWDASPVGTWDAPTRLWDS